MPNGNEPNLGYRTALAMVQKISEMNKDNLLVRAFRAVLDGDNEGVFTTPEGKCKSAIGNHFHFVNGFGSVVSKYQKDAQLMVDQGYDQKPAAVVGTPSQKQGGAKAAAKTPQDEEESDEEEDDDDDDDTDEGVKENKPETPASVASSKKHNKRKAASGTSGARSRRSKTPERKEDEAPWAYVLDLMQKDDNVLTAVEAVYAKYTLRLPDGATPTKAQRKQVVMLMQTKEGKEAAAQMYYEESTALGKR